MFKLNCQNILYLETEGVTDCMIFYFLFYFKSLNAHLTELYICPTCRNLHKMEQNRIALTESHTECSTEVWLRRGQPCIEELLPLDCDPVVME